MNVFNVTTYKFKPLLQATSRREQTDRNTVKVQFQNFDYKNFVEQKIYHNINLPFVVDDKTLKK